ncbi:MAG: HelD family protein [Acidimicrobiales bacterium]
MSLGEDSDHPDLPVEQAYLDWAYELLAEMERRAAAALADAAERAPGDWNATVAHRILNARLVTLGAADSPLCFGRIDEQVGQGASRVTAVASGEAIKSWYIGRRHVEDATGQPAVVDWRAPVSVPFYRATYRDPLGLTRRRRLLVDGRAVLDIVDERFNDPDASSLAGAAGLPDPLLAGLGRSRTGGMRDIVATIAAEQDRIIRAPLDRPVIVQGGPGTGKTAVGLHRAAWLLYEHRDKLEREGLLVLGPNPLFLAYISQVLPSLGEVAVSQTTLAGLASAWRVTAVDKPALTCLKGSASMAPLIARAAEMTCRPPAVSSQVATPWGSFEISADDLAEMLRLALGTGGPLHERRRRFNRSVARHIQLRASERAGALVDGEAVERALAADRALQTVLQRTWPSQSPAGLLRRLLGNERLMTAAATGLFETGDRKSLCRRPAKAVSSERWTAADLPLLDEARALLTGVPRRYGHIVIDEAQDLSPMALRMVARRSRDGSSLTVLGDLAQATDPGAAGSWEACLTALDLRGDADVESLTLGYRVPRPIMELANRLLADVAPHLAVTTSVRPSDLEPAIVRAGRDGLAQAVVGAARGLFAHYGSIAAIVPPWRVSAVRDAAASGGIGLVASQQASAPGQLAVLSPDLAKGLEFDAVVVGEPGEILTMPGGGGLTYIALTRAVQALIVVFEAGLPACFEVDPQVWATGSGDPDHGATDPPA